MVVNMPYNGSLTAEQFLFYEMRIVSKKYLEGTTIDEIIEYIKRDNLFQYPTEREVPRLARACQRRIVALSNDKLVYELANASVEVAKQINLYAMMRYNRLVREFMTDLIGEKYRQQDFSYTRKDINVFFSHLQEQNDDVAAWSEQTVRKLKQVLTKCLIETEMLDSVRDTTLNPIFISEELESGIRDNIDLTALAAFNCFR
ncbi:membrane protein [Paenibacillus stellifer]|uniref:Membrane protein n=1 Tax=Paenibacillus stellifer TaxID=169760 RepID=A0A089LTA7_9BACL|nr:membrane protein [Paenibacillus stellifer]